MIYLHRSEETHIQESISWSWHRFVIVYGRRRTGKTVLLKRIASRTWWRYHLCLDTSYTRQLSFLQKSIATYLDDPLLRKIQFTSYTELFAYITKHVGDQAHLFVLDEFQYLFQKYPEVLSEFQYIIDEHLKESNIKLVILGSALSLIEKNVLWYRSPLYGRKTAVFNISPFSLSDFWGFFPTYSLIELIQTYTILNGIPYYAHVRDASKSVPENITQMLTSPWSIFHDEVKNILKYEITEFRTYFTILSEIANGAHKFGEISSKTWLQKTNLSPYLQTLQDLRIITKETPILDNPLKSKKWMYRISDYFVLFWFSYVRGKQDARVMTPDIYIQNILDSFEYYISRCVEPVIIQWLRKNKLLPFAPLKIGRHRNKACEIDIVALSVDEQSVCLWEIKRSEKKIGLPVYNQLVSKKDHLWDEIATNVTHLIFVSKSWFEQALIDRASTQAKTEPHITLIDLSTTSRRT